MIENIKWFKQISTAVLRASPLEVTGIVILSLFSKISSLLALFLPIKIILLLGYDKIPKYFPDFFVSVERNTLIVSLSGLAIFFYIFYVVLEFFIERLEKRGTKKLVQKNKSGLKSKKLKVLSEKLFKRASRSITGLVFALSVMIFLAYIYFPLLAVVVVYAITALVVYELFFNNAKKTDDETDDEDEQDQTNSKIKIWFDTGFLLAFVFIIWQLMNDASIGIITAFISFLLLRKSSGDLKKLSGDIGFLLKQQANASKVIAELTTKEIDVK